jgi:streptogramin lyase
MRMKASLLVLCGAALLVPLMFLYNMMLTTTTSAAADLTTALSNESTSVMQRSTDVKVNQSMVTALQLSEPVLQEFSVPSGSRPHDVAPASDGIVWYTAQGSGEVGRLDPSTNQTHHIALGQGSAPHGVIVGPDGAPWITDGGLNAIVRVDPVTEKVQVFPLPEDTGYANLNTATFDHNGTLWFTSGPLR